MATLSIQSRGEFNSAINTGVTLVDFNAPWCGPCRSQEPILEKVAEKYAGRATVAAVNIEGHQDMAMELGIQSIPTLIIFKNNKETYRFVGLQPEETLSEALEKLLVDDE